MEKLNSQISIFNQPFNYNTHTYRSGHSEYLPDSEIVKIARKNNIRILGFSEHIPNTNIELPNENNRMLLSEVGEYLSSISNLKQANPDIIILSGFEAEFDPIKESFLGEMRSKVDYMILGQHFIKRGLDMVNPNNNPNYPIEYANTICKAIDSGLFDIVAHPDIFMQYGDTMTDENTRKLFNENSVLASQIICEKARDMGIPIEINLANIKKGIKLRDGYFKYPHPLFWDVAKEVDGLKILYGIDSHSLNDFNDLNKNVELISNIVQMVEDKLIQEIYNPVVARQNNLKLQEAYKRGQVVALSFETHIVNNAIESSIIQMPNDIDSENLIKGTIETLNSTLQVWTNNAIIKKQTIIQEIHAITNITDLPTNDRKCKVERKKKTSEEIDIVLSNQQQIIERIKNTLLNVMRMGYENKEQFLNMMVQLTQYNSTWNDIQRLQIQENIDKLTN